jgi:hypothetical protein
MPKQTSKLPELYLQQTPSNRPIIRKSKSDKHPTAIASGPHGNQTEGQSDSEREVQQWIKEHPARPRGTLPAGPIQPVQTKHRRKDRLLKITNYLHMGVNRLLQGRNVITGEPVLGEGWCKTDGYRTLICSPRLAL